MRALLGLLPGALLVGLLTAPPAAAAVAPTVRAVPVAATTVPERAVSTQVLLETGVIKAINTMRVRRGCRALTNVSTLHLAARRHSNLMASRKQLRHQLAGEATLSTRVRRAGYTGATMLGEVLATGARQPADALRMWMNSPRHRALLVDCRFRHVGTGVTANSDGRRWWTVDLARR
ncbi:hypothetical protein ASE01_03575 [Nocardioides sp. Root190]|uniref:CAP domain-containing protein n=1 Tax=Nocardioides sp. Root190 TaxID=1736488 RepID=UPI0007006E98|nr:CAP domain-containing protein [Nocardioides sp. Root190]KRB78366.1 hypothetical protein ASE01_03575 [Nocardioides sp. Root190]